MKTLQFEEWDGKDLEGDWWFTVKKDGIQVKRNEKGEYVSRKGNPLYNLPDDIKDPGFEIAEVFTGSWNETWSIVSASKSPRRKIDIDEIYTIYPEYDPRLILGLSSNPTAKIIRSMFKTINNNGKGDEGLVLNQGDRYIKVKPKKTVDVQIRGFNISTAKSHKGLLKEFITDMGKVGTGLTREQRREYLDDSLIGTYIEVEVTKINESGKWRDPRFVRLRPDK